MQENDKPIETADTSLEIGITVFIVHFSFAYYLS